MVITNSIDLGWIVHFDYWKCTVDCSRFRRLWRILMVSSGRLGCGFTCRM